MEKDLLSGLHAPVSEEVFAASPVLGAVRDHVRVLEAAARDRDRLVNTTLQTGPLDLDVHVDTDTGVCINGMDLRVVGLGLIQLAMRLPTLTPGTSHTVIASDRPDRSDPPPAAGTGVVSVWLRELVGSLDALVSAATAAQVHAKVMLEAQVRSEARQAGIAHKEAGHIARGVVQVSTRTSSSVVSRRLSGCRRVVRSMPGTLALMATGQLPLPVVEQIGTRAHGLDEEDLAILDAALVQDTGMMVGKGTRAWGTHTAQVATQIRPEASTHRHASERQLRHLSVQHGPAGMSHLHAYLPTVDAVAISSMIRKEADRLTATGQTMMEGRPRTFGQLEVDVLTGALLGRREGQSPMRVELQVTMDARTLISPSRTATVLVNGVGPIPGNTVRDQIIDTILEHEAASPEPMDDPSNEHGPANDDARGEDAGAGGGQETVQHPLRPPGSLGSSDMSGLPELAPGVPAIPGVVRGTSALPRPRTGLERRAVELERGRRRVVREARVVLRRLFTHPENGQLIAMESRARYFPPALARFLRMRDLECRGPYCNASVRHLDHIFPYGQGGSTSAENAQGLCASCNLVRETFSQATGTLDEDGTHHVTWNLNTGQHVTTTNRPLNYHNHLHRGGPPTTTDTPVTRSCGEAGDNSEAGDSTDARDPRADQSR